MDEKHVRKVAKNMIQSYMEKSNQKPSVDISLCRKCDKMTDNWYVQSSVIIWMCKDCRDKISEQNRVNLETILEKMCEDESR